MNESWRFWAVGLRQAGGHWSVKIGKNSWLALLVRGHYEDQTEMIAARHPLTRIGPETREMFLYLWQNLHLMKKARLSLSLYLLLALPATACTAADIEMETEADIESGSSPSVSEGQLPETVPEPADDEGFVTLFNGEDLEGWHRLDTLPESNVGGKWEVVDGILEGDQDPPGRGGLLVTDQKDYRDFILKLEAKIDYPADSGLFLRVAADGKSHQVTLDNVENGSFGSIYLPWTQGMVMENKIGQRFFKPGEWNSVTVKMEGEPAHIQVWLNGKLITDFQHTAETTEGNPEEGFIAVQVHPGKRWQEGNKVRFRNIRVKRLNPEHR